MKFLKEDGTIDDGTPLDSAQAAEFLAVKDLVHEHICRHSSHYSWQPEAKCLTIARRIAVGEDYRTVLFSVLDPQPEPTPELTTTPAPVPVPDQPTVVVETEKDEIPL